MIIELFFVLCAIKANMINTPYIKVAVTLPVLNTYTYRVPDDLKETCDLGMRVLVPFGKRRVTGYVVSKEKESGPYKTKDVIELLDDHPLFPRSSLPFFQWISDYYIHPMGDVIKTALPSGLDQHDRICAFVTQKGRGVLNSGDSTIKGFSVLEYVANKEPCVVQHLKKKINIRGFDSLLNQMEKEDLIRISAVLKKDSAGIKLEKFIRIGKGPTKVIRMSKKRLQILEIVGQKDEISLTGLKEQVPTAPTLIKPLEASGYIEIEKRQVFRDPLGDPVEPDQPPGLTDEQQKAVDMVESSEKGFAAYLLSGVTGSGKTEVYMRLVMDAIEQGKTAIVLVPEISLISQTERRFRARFGDRIAVIHSALTHGERLDQWRKIALNKVSVVIGARSAVFAPFENIGIIIVDEEHDTSYKQETGLRYNARDLAVVRASLQGCPVVLGSATPSVQSYQNVMDGRFTELSLKKRINQHPLPDITLVDLKEFQDIKGIDRVITPVLQKQIQQCLEKGEQALVFLNRRGYATFPVCRDCGESLSCRFCDVTMTFHKGYNQYRCHLCDYVRPVNAVCPDCGSDKIKPLGFGTERVETMLRTLFPDARILRMDQDTTRKKGSMVKILKNIRNHNVDIIVGTQMLAKGHDFPSITLVGVVCADLSLSLPDFRAGERTFQLLAQVSGRAGRGKTPGRVVMQTYTPDHFIIQASQKQDFFDFFVNETPFRKALMYPPFARMIQLKISGSNHEQVKQYARLVADLLKQWVEMFGEQNNEVQILGPVEAPIQKISSRFRHQILAKSQSSSYLNQMVKAIMGHPDAVPKKGIRMSVDVDPYFLM